jgi:hypothetical protein
MRLDWRRLAARLPPACGFTRLSGVHRTVSDAQTSASTNSLLSGIVAEAAAKIHRTVWCAPVGDGYPPGPLEGKKASRKALGLLSREAIPSWARGELLVEWADAANEQTRAQTTHWI